MAIAVGDATLGISGSSGFSMALKADGTVAAWGADDFGQTDLPAGLSNVVAIAAGHVHGVVLKADGTVATWGSFGATHPAPEDLTNVVAIAAGGWVQEVNLTWAPGFVIALKVDGTIVAWGDDDQGQTDLPPGLTNVLAIAAGPDSGMALVGSGPPQLHASVGNPQHDAQGFRCAVPSELGHVYRLEYKTSLTSTDWMALPLVAGIGGSLTLRDATPGDTQRFYRVRRW